MNLPQDFLQSQLCSCSDRVRFVCLSRSLLLSYFENSCSWMDFSASVPDLNKNEEVNETRKESRDKSNIQCLLASN